MLCSLDWLVLEIRTILSIFGSVLCSDLKSTLSNAHRATPAFFWEVLELCIFFRPCTLSCFQVGFLKAAYSWILLFLFILIIFHFNRGTFNIICLDLNLSSCYLFSISSILSLFHFTYFGLIDCFIAFYESILFLLFG